MVKVSEKERERGGTRTKQSCEAEAERKKECQAEEGMGPVQRTKLISAHQFAKGSCLLRREANFLRYGF